MSSYSSQHSSTLPAFEFKSGSITTPVLHIFNTDINLITDQLRDKVNQSPQFFTHSPILIDLENTTEDTLNLALLVAAIRNANMIPIGIRGGTETQRNNAKELNLSVLSGFRASSQPLTEAPPKVEVIESTPAPTQAPEIVQTPELAPAIETITEPTMVINHVVRSGQQIYSKGDLIVLASVGAGAEIIAEGNIHIYGTLRGRALAGVLGDETARIFCSTLEAELISIAGNFRINEDIDKEMSNTPVKIHLNKQALIIEKI